MWPSQGRGHFLLSPEVRTYSPTQLPFLSPLPAVCGVTSDQGHRTGTRQSQRLWLLGSGPYTPLGKPT